MVKIDGESFKCSFQFVYTGAACRQEQVVLSNCDIDVNNIRRRGLWLLLAPRFGLTL